MKRLKSSSILASLLALLMQISLFAQKVPCSSSLEQDYWTHFSGRTATNETLVISLDDSTPIQSFALSGELTFSTPRGYFQALLQDNKGKEYMIFREIGSFYKRGETISLNDVGVETSFLQNIKPQRLIILADGCSFRVNKVNVSPSSYKKKSGIPINEIQKQAESRKIDFQKMEISRINSYNKKHNVLWIAGETSLSALPYEERKKAFGMSGDAKDTYGWEYYRGGILSPWGVDYDSLVFYETNTAPYVESFSWTNRHGINWNTKPRDQMNPLVGGCWAHGVLSAFEAYINIYRGEKVDHEMSIQELLSCSAPASALSYKTEKGGLGSFPHYAKDYIVNSGLMSEADFPLNPDLYHEGNEKNIAQYCNQKASLPYMWYKPKSVIEISANNDQTNSHINLMHAILNYGPGAVTIDEYRHVMCIVGWGMVKPGLFMEYWPPHWDPIVVTKDHPLANKVYWIFKNSCGEEWGYNGYACLVRSKPKYNVDYNHDPEGYKKPKGKTSFIDCYFFKGGLEMEILHESSPIQMKAYDNDGDGYYRWGLVGRPEGIYELEDADDSDPTIGPMNKYGIPNKLKHSDLYIRDSHYDKGVEPNTLNNVGWESPDIILTSSFKGKNHENPVRWTDKENPLYIKVVIHNKGDSPSSHRAMLHLQWKKSNLFSSFQDISLYQTSTQSALDSLGIDWDYFKQTSGTICKDEPIPIIKPGDSATVTLEWYPPIELEKYNNKINITLLAEIICIDDAYYNTDRGYSDSYVLQNNNVAQKSVTITDLEFEPIPIDPQFPGIDCNNLSDNVPEVIRELCRHKARTAPLYLYTESPNCNLENCRIRIYEVGNEGSPLADEAEVRLCGDANFRKAVSSGLTLKGIKEDPATGDFVFLNNEATIEGLSKLKGSISSIQLQINFLTQKASNTSEYKYHVVLEDIATGERVNGHTYVINKPQRKRKFKATIEQTKEADKEVFSAKSIEENAQYLWKDTEGNLIAEGRHVPTDCFDKQDAIILEVTASKDGFRDYDTIEMPKKTQSTPILLVSPNPAHEYIDVAYSIVGQGVLLLSSLSGDITQRYSLEKNSNRKRIDISPLKVGSYTISLYDDGKRIGETILHKEL